LDYRAVSAVERPVVAFLPDVPGDDDHHGVEGATETVRDLLSRADPPVLERGAVRGCKAQEASSHEKARPDIPREDAGDKKVINGLVMLAAQCTGGLRPQPMASPTLRSPKPPVEGEPKEEFHLRWNHSFPGEHHALHPHSTQEEGSVGRGR